MVIRVTIQNTLTDSIISFELDEDTDIEGIKLTIAAEMGIDVDQ